MYLVFHSACIVIRFEAVTDVCCFPGCRRVCRRERCWPTTRSTSHCRRQTPASGRLTRFCGSMSRSSTLLAGDSATPGAQSMVQDYKNSASGCKKSSRSGDPLFYVLNFRSHSAQKVLPSINFLATPEKIPYTSIALLSVRARYFERTERYDASNKVLWWLAGMWRRAWASRCLILRPWPRNSPKMTCWMTSPILSLTSSYRCRCPCHASFLHAQCKLEDMDVS